MERVELSRLLAEILERSQVRAVADTDNANVRDVVIEERDPALFMKAFASTVAAGGNVFLADPSWGPTERAQFDALIAQTPSPASAGQTNLPADFDRAHERGWLCIPTGGSSGNIKLARHDQDTIASAVEGFCAHFGVEKINAVGLLPLYHVSGYMAWMRTVLTGGAYLPWSWKALEAGERPPLPASEGDWFLSLVPTQLQRLLGDNEAVDWLRSFRAIFIGGGPSWPELIEAGARERLPLAFSYGMTETAAMICALRPEEFVAGVRGSGTALPHAQVELDAGEGRIGIASASLFRGYWPASSRGENGSTTTDAAWWTEDLGRIDGDGSLHVIGRRDALIITGGEKVDPAEVETALRATGKFRDVAVLSVPDPQWGEAVVACFPKSEGAAVSLASEGEELLKNLAAYKRPKRYIAIDDWPRNAQGKVNRAVLRALIAAC